MDNTSPVSPVELPRPYDISAAVQQALNLNVAGGRSLHSDDAELEEQPRRSLDCSFQGDSLDEEEIEELLPELGMLGEDVWTDVALPDVDTKGSITPDNSANMEELERFCKYIDGDEEGPQDLVKMKREKSNSNPPIVTTNKCLGRAPRQTPGPPSSSPGSSNYSVTLDNAGLWQQFSQIGTEMVITKNGRRMFPAISILINNLNPEDIYSLYLDILPADDRRYKFMQTEWLPVGKVDKKFSYRTYMHPESPNTGVFWLEKPVTFKFLKLTNNKNTIYRDQVILNSMQKYIPTIRLVCETTRMSHTYQFPETAFIAVTAYQNSKITQLKIDNNPYARAFRDSISSDNSVNEGVKRGGHYRHSSKPSASVSSHAPVIKHASATVVSTSRGSATSVESGFESSSSTEILGWIPTALPSTIQPMETHYDCNPPFNYWSDEPCLYTNSLVYAPPQMMETFTEASYIHQGPPPHMYLESPDATLVSPMETTGIPGPHPQPCFIDPHCFSAPSSHHPLPPHPPPPHLHPSKPPFSMNMSFEDDDDVFI